MSVEDDQQNMSVNKTAIYLARAMSIDSILQRD